MIEIELQRHVVEGVFRLTQNLAPEEFKTSRKAKIYRSVYRLLNPLGKRSELLLGSGVPAAIEPV